MPEDLDSPGPTPANYQRTTGGHLRWRPPSPEQLQELLPAYEILSILGQGGMGAVYKGRQKSLDRLVAIKLLPPEAADNDMQFVERFKNEARTMARMNHPAIVHVYDFGETSDGQLYIVMEFIDGTDVAKMIQSQGKMPPEHALAVTAHVCDALQYAHTHGVVHRDIKPANILINMEGQVKVADFGLAKSNESGQDGLTKTNMAMGTPDFVAPEALTPGMTVDGRADLYAVGVMLYNMLTGQVPRGAFHMPSVSQATDRRYDSIISKAMQMDRALRYQSAMEIRRDLDVILTTPQARMGVQTLPVKPRDLPQKPVARVPGTSPQQPRMAGTAGAPVRTQQPPTGGAPAKPPARKTVQNAQVFAEPAPKKSTAALCYGIAAVALLATAAMLLSPRTREHAESRQVPEKPQPAPAATVLRSGAFTLKAADAKPSSGTKLNTKEAFVYNWSTNSKLEWSQEQVAAGTYEITLSAGGFRPREHEMRLEIGGQSLNFPLRSETSSGYKMADFKVGVIKLTSTAKGILLRCVDEGKVEKDKYRENDFNLAAIKFSPSSASPTSPSPTPPVPTATPSADVLAFAGHRYQFISGKESWTEARGKAESMGGHLVTITSKEEDEFLSKSFQDKLAKDSDFVFIGGIASPTPDWTWVTGESFTYRPSFSFREAETRILCVEKASGKLRWRVQPTGTRGQGFIIEWDDDGKTPATPILTFAGHRYQLITEKLQWEAAKAKAESMGGHLATITTKEENDWVKKNIGTQLKKTPADSNGNRFYIGAIQSNPPDGPWEWVSDEPYSHQSWMGNFPNDHNDAVKVSTVNSAGWDDVLRSYEPLSFLVEWDDNGIIFHKAELSPPSVAPPVAEVMKPVEPAPKPAPMPAAAASEPAPPADPRLAQLEAGYQSRYDSDAEKPFQAAVAALNQSYVVNGIARARIAAQAKGSLAEINALDAEKAAIEAGRGVPAEDDADTPESLKTLRSTYRTVLAQHAANRAAAAAPLLQLYLGALDAYVSELTKAGKIEEARQVQALRDAKAKPPPSAETAAAPSPAQAADGNGFTNSLGMKFVPVKGTNTMFCIHETRRKDYAAYAAENPSIDGSWKKANRNGIPVGDKDDHPVVAVNWDEAHKFCEWLSKKGGKTYRLPTDEEWSIAVGIAHQENRVKESTPESLRFGVKDEYPWGGNFPPKTKDKAGNYFDISHAEKFNAKARLLESKLEDYDDGFATTAPVMSFRPNKLGIYDLGGNADEWVEDWFKADQKDRTIRGMNWLFSGSKMDQDMLSSQRGHTPPDKHDVTTGFRIVLEAPKKTP